uniref:Uncharacterized protein n=1 Tax=Panagrolaimus superbus TaxID=310955 RepID=A0A914XW92_9BILA
MLSKRRLNEEREGRKLAEKDAADAKTKSTEDFAKWSKEYEEKNSFNEMKENIGELKNQLVQLQSLTATDVIQGIQHLTKNLSSFFPSEKKEGPMWLVKKEICEAIYKNAQDEVKPFIANYLPELFKWGELILPENLLSKEKRAETDEIVAYFYKVVGIQQKELYGKMIKVAFEKLRSAGRQRIYALVRKHGIIGFTPEGSCFFYQREPSGRFIPYSDAEYLHPLQVQISSDQMYCIPIEYEAADFLMVVENSVNNGITYYQIDPKSGYKKLVYSNGRNSKKGL